MFLPEREVDLASGRLLGSSLDIACCSIGSTEVDTNVGLDSTLQTVQVGAVGDTISHALEEASEVGTSKVSSGLEFGERINIGTNTVQHDVVGSVVVELLGEVGVDLQELVTIATRKVGGFLRLSLERREEDLEPFEGGGVFANPDEFDTSETGWWVGTIAHVPDVLENSSPGSNTDTGSDENGDFVVEDILSWCSVGTVDLDLRHLLSVLESDFVHAHGVNIIVKLGLSGSGSKSVTESAGEVSNLSDVDGDIRIEWTGSNGKWMPLLLGNAGNLDEQPLSRLVLHGWLNKLDLNSIIWMTDDLDNLGITSGSVFTVETLKEVESTSPELPTPSLISQAELPEFLSSKWRVWQLGATDEASSGVGVQTEHEGNEKVVSVPESLE